VGLEKPRHGARFLTAHGGHDKTWPSPDAVTICVQLDTRRLSQLAAKAANYRGPISAVIYISSADVEVDFVRKAWEKDEYMQRYVDIHLYYHDPASLGEEIVSSTSGSETDRLNEVDNKIIQGKPLYPANKMRNLAIQEARTEWILTLEVDLVLSPHAASTLRKVSEMSLSPHDFTEGKSSIYPACDEKGEMDWNGERVPCPDKPPQERWAFVVPLLQEAGEETSCAGAYSQGSIKKSSELPANISDGRSWPLLKGCGYMSHDFMDYDHWMERGVGILPLPLLSPGIYQQDQPTRPLYEPYFVTKRSWLPRFDDAVLFCTYDKMDQMFRMQQLRFGFFSLRGVYLLHLDRDRDYFSSEDEHKQREVEILLPPHAGRLLCDIGDNETAMSLYGEESEEGPAEITFFGQMRVHQWLFSDVSWFRETVTQSPTTVLKTRHSPIKFQAFEGSTAVHDGFAEIDTGAGHEVRAGEGCS